MCAILGVVAQDAPNPGMAEAVQKATASMAHRGPGGQSIYHRDSVWLGHCYLPIIDPPHGVQPMHRAGRLSIVFNGEIYNAAELRAELRAKGSAFITNTDTEIILAAYEEWGIECLTRLRGMFAMALADWESGKIHLARDPLGIKPLFYFEGQGLFAFASEITALRLIPQVRVADEMDLEALDDYLRLLYIPCPRTIYKHIRKLPPAHFLSLDMSTGQSHLCRYWRLEYCPDESLSAEDWQEATEEVLRQSIRTHLTADVNVGALLSGGVDSTLVAREMSELSGGSVTTFSTGFSGHMESDEREHARRVAGILGATHSEISMTAKVGGLLSAVARACGEPFGDSSIICAWEVCRFAKDQVGVVLTGDGGDEFFGGYPLHREWVRRSRWSSGPHPAWKRLIQPMLHQVSPQKFPNLTTGPVPGPEIWAECVEYFQPLPRRRLWRDELWCEEFSAKAPASIRESFSAHADVSGMARAQTCDIEVYLPGDILPKIDVASMAHGLEARTPFVDVRVAEFAARIPERFLATGDPAKAQSWSGKEPLKKWMAKHLPADLVRRPKQGFTAPLRHWLVDDAGTRDRLRSALESGGSPLRQWFNPRELRAIGSSSQHHLQWQMLFLSVWHEESRKS